MAARNASLERDNQELKACADRENKRPKRFDNIIIKIPTSFNAIINSELSDPSLANF
jgi:hypothetical protein